MAPPQKGDTAATKPEIKPPPGLTRTFTTVGRVKPKKDADNKPKAPVGKRMKDGYWAGGIKMFKPNGNGRCDARARAALSPLPFVTDLGDRALLHSNRDLGRGVGVLYAC